MDTFVEEISGWYFMTQLGRYEGKFEYNVKTRNAYKISDFYCGFKRFLAGVSKVELTVD